MSIKDNNRAALVRTLIKQNGGRIFTVIARRKSPVTTYTHKTGLCFEALAVLKEPDYKRAIKKGEIDASDYDADVEHFMEMTCRTGVKSQLASSKPIHYEYDDKAHDVCHDISVSEFNCLCEDAKGQYSPVYKETKSSISHCPDLISVNLTNGRGYRCFSTFMVLEIRAGGAVIKFKEADVLAYVETK